MKKKLVVLSIFSVMLLTLVFVLVMRNHDPKNKTNATSVTHKIVKKRPMTAAQLVDKLKKENLPIDNVIVYNEKNDVNKLLGRPKQYISKVNFADTGLDQYDDPENPNGGSIETFRNTKDLNTRKTYLESLGKGSPLFIEYDIAKGNYLLRLSKDLTSDQVNKYKKAFMSIK